MKRILDYEGLVSFTVGDEGADVGPIWLEDLGEAMAWRLAANLPREHDSVHPYSICSGRLHILVELVEEGE